jgi:RNA polymerase sigma factor (TIGR02999 family)
MDAADHTGDDTGDLTQLLQAWKGGSRDAFDCLVRALHRDLLRMAASRLRAAHDASLSRGDVVSEALLRLMATPPQDWQSRAHFFGAVSLTMRSVLCDHARARLRDKRGGGAVKLTLSGLAIGEESMAADVLTLDRLLQELEAIDPRAQQVLQMTYFTSLSRDDIAEVMEVSTRTIDRELRFGRAWLAERLGRELEA